MLIYALLGYYQKVSTFADCEIDVPHTIPGIGAGFHPRGKPGPRRGNHPVRPRRLPRGGKGHGNLPCGGIQIRSRPRQPDDRHPHSRDRHLRLAASREAEPARLAQGPAGLHDVGQDRLDLHSRLDGQGQGGLRSLVLLAQQEGAEGIRRRAEDERKDSQIGLAAQGQGAQAGDTRQHSRGDPAHTRDLRPPGLAALQEAGRLDHRPGLPRHLRIRTGHELQLPFLRLPLPAQGRQRHLAGRSRLAAAVLQLLQPPQRRKGGVLRRARIMELLAEDPPQLQQQDPVHRARLFRHPARQGREGVGQPAHIHHAEHNPRAQLRHTL